LRFQGTRVAIRSGVVVTDAPQVGVGSELDVQPGDTDYPTEYKLAAVLLTVIAPFVTLVAALIMRGSQSSPIRRARLRTWAVISGAWLAVGHGNFRYPCADGGSTVVHFGQ
jgi:hypothetical protein